MVVLASVAVESPGGTSQWQCELPGSEGRSLTVQARSCGDVASDALDECAPCEDSATWRSFMGGCEVYAASYSSGGHSSQHHYCNQDDDDSTGVLALVACPVSCETCSGLSAQPAAPGASCSASCAESVLPAVDQHCAQAIDSLSPGLEARCRSEVDDILSGLPERIELSGACSSLAHYNGEYVLQPMTVNGHAHYTSAGGEGHLVWRSGRWALAEGLAQSSSEDGHTTAPSFRGIQTWHLQCCDSSSGDATSEIPMVPCQLSSGLCYDPSLGARPNPQGDKAAN